MAVKRQLGAILLESGRINQTDVDKVLDYQRTHGGFFGQAIVALGILSREEIDWALASQFDLPFIFPNADAVDREAAMLVPADWALAHLAVPIVKAGRSLTVVVADPLDNDTLEDLHARTGLEVEMALASASRIRELIRSIYGDTGPVKATESPVSLTDLMTQAFDSGADRIGVSVRNATATGWYAARGARERRQLVDGWATSLEDMLEPAPFDASREKGALHKYDATLRRAGVESAVEVQVLTSTSGTEFLIRPTSVDSPKRATATLPTSVATELRLLARGGQAHVAVRGADDAIVRALAPQLPALVFGDGVRAAHVASEEVAGVYTMIAGADVVAAVEAYDFDALSIDLDLDDPRVQRIMSAAPLSFLFVSSAGDRAALADAGINWMLAVTQDQDSLVWELRPVNR